MTFCAIFMICGALLGVSLGHFCKTNRILFLSVILGAILELPWYFRGTSVVSRWRPDDGQARVRVLFRTRLLRVVTMIQYAHLPCFRHGAADPIACGLPATVP